MGHWSVWRETTAWDCCRSWFKLRGGDFTHALSSNKVIQSPNAFFLVNFYPIIVCMIFKCTSLLSFLILKRNKQHVRFFFGVALLMYSINFKSIHKQHACFFLLYSFGGFSLLLIQASHEPNAIHISFHTQIEWTTHLL